MICPVCKIDMIVVEYRQVEIDYCHNCSGIWFDAGELELLLKTAGLGTSGLPTLEGAAPETRSHGQRKCPICAQKMGEVSLSEPPIHVDVCPNSDGIWFDGGELQQLLTRLEARPGTAPEAIKQVTAFIGETFKDKKTR